MTPPRGKTDTSRIYIELTLPAKLYHRLADRGDIFPPGYDTYGTVSDSLRDTIIAAAMAHSLLKEASK